MPNAWPDLSDALPAGFRLRSGFDPAGMVMFGEQIGPAEAPGVNLLTLVSVIAGEPLGEKPDAVCAFTLAPFARLLSDMNDDLRDDLVPFAWALAGTASEAHAAGRLEILGRMACAIAERQLPAFRAASDGDDRPDAALAAALAYWDAKDDAAATAANAASQAATQAANGVFGKAEPRLAGLAAHSAAGAAHAAHQAHLAFYAGSAFYTALGVDQLAPLFADRTPGRAATGELARGMCQRFASNAADHAAMASLTPEDVPNANWRADVAEITLAGFRAAVEAGPYGAAPANVALDRIRAARGALGM